MPPRTAPPPYSTQKSKRGRTKHSDTHGHACLNPDCLYFGSTNAAVHALVADGWDGQQRDIRRFRCQACQHVFSSRRHTPRFRQQKPLPLVQSAFLLLALGMSRADIARVLGIDDDTVARWLDRFGKHADHLHDTLLRDLAPQILQLDEIRTELRATPRIRWLWLAIDPKTKLVLNYLLASRKTPDAMPFIHRLRDRLAPGHIPAFLSDGLHQYHALLTAHFGTWVDGVWVVSSQLHLAQIVKILRSRRLIATFPRALCGSLRHVQQQLRELGFTGIIQTAFIERVNLSIRHGVGALHRRTWATCRRPDRLQAHVALYLSFYHFVRPHSALRQGKLNRTPAMAASLTDHCWTVEEWLTRPV